MPVEPSSARKQKILNVFFQKRAIELQTAVIHKVRRFAMQPGATRFIASFLNVNPQLASSQKNPR